MKTPPLSIENKPNEILSTFNNPHFSDLQLDAETINIYRKAAQEGNAIAQYNLGFCYYFGAGIRKNRTLAVKWFRKSAEQGNSISVFIIKQNKQTK